jgi:hypothetical protein
MRPVALLVLGCIAPLLTHAQEHHVDVGYRYLYAPRWDRMVQTYNVSRPFLDELQPLLQHGIGMGYAYFFSGERRLRSGLSIGYDRFISHADASGLESRIRLHQLRIGYTARILPQERERPWQVEVGASVLGNHLSRLVNDASIEDEELRPRSLGLGAEVNVLVGRRMAIGDHRWLMPYIRVGIAPYVHQPSAEPVLNQTRGLVAGDGTFMLTVGAGVQVILHHTRALPPVPPAPNAE